MSSAPTAPSCQRANWSRSDDLHVDGFPRGDHTSNARRVPPDAVDHARRERVEEGQTHEEQPRFFIHDPGVVPRLAVGAEHGQIDPGETRIESRAPDHVRNVEDTAVFEDWQPILHVDDARDPNHASVGQILRPGSNEWRRPVQHLRAHAATDRIRWTTTRSMKRLSPRRAASPSTRKGACPVSGPAIHVLWRTAVSTAISAPELPTPTISASPGASCDGLRYCFEWSWTIRCDSFRANAGTRGRWYYAITTTTFC